MHRAALLSMKMIVCTVLLVLLVLPVQPQQQGKPMAPQRIPTLSAAPYQQRPPQRPPGPARDRGLNEDDYRNIPPAASPTQPVPKPETGEDGIGVDVAVGMTVVRGPDWRYGDQDGGKGRVGTVVELREWNVGANGTSVPGGVRVHWMSGGVNVYRYGAQGAYDLRVVDQSISDIDWEAVTAQLPDNYKVSNQKSRRARVSTHGGDLAVLKELYHSTGGPLWIAAKGWHVGCTDSNSSNTTDPCRDEWSGVRCDANAKPARVFAVDLSSNRLSGPIPPSIGNLTKLKTLNLAMNRLTGKIPTSMGGLQHLEFLSLEVNHLRGELPGTLGNLHRMRWFSVYNNQLSGIIPLELLRLPMLSHVFLQQNGFTGPRPIFASPTISSVQLHQNQWDPSTTSEL